MKAIVLLFALLISAGAQAQYKCVIKGQSVYSDHPCSRDAPHLGKAQDSVTDDERAQAENIRAKERAWRNSIEAREAEEAAARRRVAIQQSAETRAFESNCAVREREILIAERAEARYTDYGWQASRAQRAAEAAKLKEAYRRECQ